MTKITKKILTFAAGVLLCTLFLGVQAKAAVPTIKPTVLKDFKTSKTKVATYEITIQEGQESLVVPVVIAKNGRFALSGSAPDGLGCSMYTDAACTKPYIDYFDWHLNDGRYNWYKKSTYYLKLEKESWGDFCDEYYNELTGEYDTIWKEAVVNIKAYGYSAEDVSLKNGQWVTLSAPEKATYCKIVAPKRGYLQIDAKMKKSDNSCDAEWVLCNSKKKVFELTESRLWGKSGDAMTNYLAVEKGTYYLKVTNAYGGDGSYRLRYTFHSNPNKTNFTKKKALTLKAGKIVRNVSYSKDKKSTFTRWYKIKVPKKKRLTITSSGCGWSLYDAKGRYVSTIYDKGAYYTENKIKAGTYYICISTGGWNFKTKKRTMGQVGTFKWK